MEAEISGFGSDGEGSITAMLWQQLNGENDLCMPEKNLVREVLIEAIKTFCRVGDRGGSPVKRGRGGPAGRNKERAIKEARAWISEDKADDYYSFNGAWGLIFPEFPAEMARKIILRKPAMIRARLKKYALVTGNGAFLSKKRLLAKRGVADGLQKLRVEGGEAA